jgi:N-acetylglucosaminyldiphosphoundecaprenol N-acetyl-beta-D-mannosaminyltransferase
MPTNAPSGEVESKPRSELEPAPSPLVREGWGGGYETHAQTHQDFTPAPDPSPRGGGEHPESAAPPGDNLNKTCLEPAVTFEFQKFRIRGVNVAAINVDRACDLIGQLARHGKGTYVTVTGAHGIVESVYDDEIREAHQQAAAVVADGMPLVWLGRRLGFTAIGRVYGPDLVAGVFARRELRQLRHFFYGSMPAVVEKLTASLSSRFGEFNLVGTYSPPMRPIGFVENEAVLSRMRELRPNIIWVGLSSPKQEIWLRNHMRQIGSGVGIGVGAAFDLMSGSTPQAPRFIQRSGCEWLFRLAMEPGRLHKRYAFIVPRFLFLIIEALLTPRRQAAQQRPATASTDKAVAES